MPTYSYACTVCDHRFDAVQKFSDDSLTVCPECQGRLRKVFNSVGVVFKGSGFYRTDSRSGSGKSDSLASSSGSSPDGGAGKDSGASKDGGASKDSGSATSTSSSSAAAKTSTSSSSTAAG